MIKGFYLRTLDILGQQRPGPFREMRDALQINKPLIITLDNNNNVGYLFRHPKMVYTLSQGNYLTTFKGDCDFKYLEDTDMRKNWESVIVNSNFSFYQVFQQKSVELFPVLEGIIQKTVPEASNLCWPWEHWAFAPEKNSDPICNCLVNLCFLDHGLPYLILLFRLGETEIMSMCTSIVL